MNWKWLGGVESERMEIGRATERYALERWKAQQGRNSATLDVETRLKRLESEQNADTLGKMFFPGNSVDFEHEFSTPCPFLKLQLLASPYLPWIIQGRTSVTFTRCNAASSHEFSVTDFRPKIAWGQWVDLIDSRIIRLQFFNIRFQGQFIFLLEYSVRALSVSWNFKESLLASYELIIFWKMQIVSAAPLWKTVTGYSLNYRNSSIRVIWNIQSGEESKHF